MHAAPNAMIRPAPGLRAPGLIALLIGCSAFLAATAINAQTPAAQSTAPPQAAASAPDAPPDQPPSASGGAPASSSPPVAIVPLDKSIPGAALSVAGPLRAFNGRAFITSSGTITAGDATAQVTLPYRGTLRVCASGTVKLAADSSAPVGEVPGLLIALDHGAVEMSFAASTARERNADTLLTPYFRIMIGGPNPADVKVRLGENGDTCVDNAGANAPYVVVTSVFEGGLYRVQPGQRVMFEHGSLQTVVDQEKEPCGCPPPVKSEANDFPLALSEGLAPASPPASSASSQPSSAPNGTATFTYNAGDRAAQTTPVPAAAPAAQPPTTPAAQSSGSQKKPGFFRRVGRFFKRIFGAE